MLLQQYFKTQKSPTQAYNPRNSTFDIKIPKYEIKSLKFPNKPNTKGQTLVYKTFPSEHRTKEAEHKTSKYSGILTGKWSKYKGAT